jgi:hypothetical protein
MANYWIEHCAPPRPRPQGFEWDVFVSYRSLDRVWAVTLYDMLTQCGYRVFLDQYVLVPGKGLASQLAKQLRQSGSGVLIWSERSADSTWVENEMDAMVARKNDAGAAFPFHFVVASLDHQEPPGLQGGQLYMDFSDYPDGPIGTDLVRLTFGLQGLPPNASAVQQLLAFERAIKEEPTALRAMARSQLYDRIEMRVMGDTAAYTTSATLPSLAIQLLISGRQYAAALRAIATALERFPNSVRLRQLRGLALRRDRQLDDAALELNLLLEQGHRDVETLGILAAVWADLWEKRSLAGEAASARDALEQSRNLYKEGFTKVPSDTYTGINAASKTALLGDLDGARALADQVLARLSEMAVARGGGPSTDYWERATEPEALLLKGEWEPAVALYHDARVAHQHEPGSIASTATQVRRLLGVLPVPDDIKAKLTAEFGIT